ncbi:MAG: hypothetical protein IJ064_05790 [Bacteroidaceae bacterium]|nr:hypothetical protein [Bacteroidaceae bacterium]
MQQKSNAVVAVYGKRDNFLITFNPDMQRDICTNPEVCFFGGAPTLGLLNTTYGGNTAAMWLVPQLYNLSEYCGCKDKLEGNPLKECATVIAAEFSYLSVTELMLFFFRFKSGKYGRFYGSIDPLVITTSLREFLKERSIAIDRHEQEERERLREEEARKPKLTWEEYCLQEYGEVRPHPLSRRREAKKEAKPQAAEDAESVVRIAKSLMNDPNADDNTKAIFAKMFKKKYGKTPIEYIAEHDNK